jgi:hypothetical protein
MALRFYQLRYSPLRIRIAYALSCLSRRRTEENIFIHKRIIRGGFRNEKELFEHYAKISGKPLGEIRRKFGRENGILSLLSRRYYSGAHAVIDQVQKMHLGLVPKPYQKLQTLEIDASGRRKTGFDPDGTGKAAGKKVCLVLGNSVVFGAGATSDETTIPGRIGHYLNESASDGEEVVVINGAIGGCNSFEELIVLMQFELKPDYVVALSGYNDPDQAFFSSSKVSAWPRFCDNRANAPIIRRILSDALNRSVIYRYARRFVSAFIAYVPKEA